MDVLQANLTTDVVHRNHITTRQLGINLGRRIQEFDYIGTRTFRR